MPKKRYTSEEIIQHLRTIELIPQSASVANVHASPLLIQIPTLEAVGLNYKHWVT